MFLIRMPPPQPANCSRDSVPSAGSRCLRSRAASCPLPVFVSTSYYLYSSRPCPMLTVTSTSDMQHVFSSTASTAHPTPVRPMPHACRPPTHPSSLVGPRSRPNFPGPVRCSSGQQSRALHLGGECSCDWKLGWFFIQTMKGITIFLRLVGATTLTSISPRHACPRVLLVARHALIRPYASMQSITREVHYAFVHTV